MFGMWMFVHLFVYRFTIDDTKLLDTFPRGFLQNDSDFLEKVSGSHKWDFETSWPLKCILHSVRPVLSFFLLYWLWKKSYVWLNFLNNVNLKCKERVEGARPQIVVGVEGGGLTFRLEETLSYWEERNDPNEFEKL